MWEQWSGTVGVGLAWVVTLCLLLVGVIGCVLPMLPGHLFLLLAAVAHRMMLGVEGSGVEWWGLLVLGGLMALSQAFEFLSGAAGARWFGGSKWGAVGAFVGSVVGLFFFPIGLLVGPLVGAVVGEMWLGKREAKPAMVSGMGSVVGTLAGMGMKLAVGLVMVLWFFADVFWIGG